MSGLDDLRTRLTHCGGSRQQDRMIEDKLRSLKKALLYSYQSATAVLEDGREFRCLINKDRLTNNQDDKILSIPFKDICLNQDKVGTTTEGIQETGVDVGSIFQWKENGTYWLVLLKHLEEKAYFRGEIRKCQYEIELENGRRQRVYVRGPQEQSIDWVQSNGIVLNKLNYTLLMIMPFSEANEDYFTRFTKLKFNGNNYEVQVKQGNSETGLLYVYLKEFYNNSIADAAIEETNNKVDETLNQESRILGDTEVHPYDIKEYSVSGLSGGVWAIDNKKLVSIAAQTDTSVILNIITGRSGKFNLIYRLDGEDDIVLPITILSL